MAFIARRLAFYVAAVWAAVTINFVIPRVMPGNAVTSALSRFQNLTPQVVKALEIEFGFHPKGSLLTQYLQYWNSVLHFNLGVSTSQYPTHVSTIIGETLPWTLALVGVATVLSFAIGTLLGVYAAWRRGGWLDRALPGLTLLQATPYFFLALLLIYLFAIKLGWLPFGQGYSLGLSPGFNWAFISSAITHSILPALTIIATSVGGWMLQMRNVMLTTISEDYILVAQAKGLSGRRVMFTYGARNAVLPNIAGFALSLGYVVAGALVMEIVFSYPGVGFTLYNAVTSNDYPLMQGIFLVISLAVLSASLLADIVYAIADPRARTRSAF
ncbi:MAG TPA: ABC transporter permease [Solirubrobacteraceae bacterium]|jgi:peptide/nickel transport system permease protein|nr:ABC transporter permease [Solirubrobacteraceae bacterium]